jgi:hypothetical protein
LLRKLIHLSSALAMALMAVTAAHAQGQAVTVYYAGAQDAVRTALTLAGDQILLVDDPSAAQVWVLNGVIPDPAATAAHLGESGGLILIMGPGTAEAQAAQTLGPVRLARHEEPLSVVGSDQGLEYGGEEVWQLYVLMKSATHEKWWFGGDDIFTFEDFVGLMLLHEGQGLAILMNLNAMAGAQNLYVGGYAPPGVAYCPSTACTNGTSNYLATLESVRDQLERYGRGTTGISEYKGYGDRGPEDPAGTLADANTYATAMLDPQRYGSAGLTYPIWPLNGDQYRALSRYSSGQRALIVTLTGLGMEPSRFYPGAYQGTGHYYISLDGYSVWYAVTHNPE